MNLSGKTAALKAALGVMHGSRAFTGPLQANFNVTNRCNIRCVHCYFHSPHIEKPNMIELRRARLLHLPLPDRKYLKDLQRLEADPALTLAVIGKLADAGTRRFQFGGHGEPFSHPHLLEFLQKAKAGGGYCVVNTNGTLLARNTIDELVRIGVDNLRITTMAGKAHTYTRTHPGCEESVFETLKGNLLYFAERKKASRHPGPEVTLVCVIVAQNCGDLFDFAEFAGTVHADKVIFHLFNDAGDPGFAGVVPTEDQSSCARQQLEKAGRHLDSLGIGHNVENALRVFRKKLNTEKLYHVIPCYLGWLAIRIDLDGGLYPCCECYAPLGNIYRQDFGDIWNGEAYAVWRKTAFAINKRKTPVEGCSCGACGHHNLNTRVYKLLHPLRSRSSAFRRLSASEAAGTE